MTSTRRFGPRWSIVWRLCAMVTSLSLGVSPALLALDQAGKRQARVKAVVGNVRSQPSPGGIVQFQVRQGETLLLLGVAGDWYHVEARDGRRGYIYKNLAEIVEPPPPPPEPAAATPPPPPQPLVAIDHKEVGCVVANQYPKLDACLVPDASVGRAQVHFRALSTDPWYAVELKPDGPCFSAFLPKPQATTPQIEYYVDVIDRGFTEVAKPEAAPAQSYRARVVKKEGDCRSALERVAFSVAKAAKPVVVSVVRDAAGKVLDQGAARLLESHLLLSGFSPQGVIVSSTGAAPGASTAASGSSGAAGGAAGAGGGIGAGTLAIVGGVAAAGAVAVAAKGGGSGSGSSSSGGGSGSPPTTQPAPINLTGTWAGPVQAQNSVSGVPACRFGTVPCQHEVTYTIQHSGSALSGSATTSGSCDLGQFGGNQPFQGSLGTFTGSASAGRIEITFGSSAFGFSPCLSATTLTGSYSQSAMSGMLSSAPCTASGCTSSGPTGTWSANRR